MKKELFPIFFLIFALISCGSESINSIVSGIDLSSVRDTNHWSEFLPSECQMDQSHFSKHSVFTVEYLKIKEGNSAKFLAVMLPTTCKTPYKLKAKDSNPDTQTIKIKSINRNFVLGDRAIESTRGEWSSKAFDKLIGELSGDSIDTSKPSKNYDLWMLSEASIKCLDDEGNNKTKYLLDYDSFFNLDLDDNSFQLYSVNQCNQISLRFINLSKQASSNLDAEVHRVTYEYEVQEED